ncbi:MAG: invasin domain 3-containing protein [Halobacteriota archaeon]
MKNANRTVVVLIAMLVLLVMPATAAEVSVIRDLPDAVSQGEGFYVTLNQSNFTLNLGAVTEKLPEGFEYVEGSAKDDKGEQVILNYSTTNELTIEFAGEANTITYLVDAGTAEQIETAEFYGTWTTLRSLGSVDILTGEVKGDKNLTLAEVTPTPTPTATPGDGNGGGGGGGIPPAPPAETLPYVHLNATPADIPADGTSTSTITASVWDGDKWVMENLTVNFSTDLGNITASVLIVNGTATGILTAGTEEGIANVRAEANLSGDIGVINATTTVNFTTPGVTPTPTPTPVVTATETPTAAETPIAAETPAGRWGIPGFEVIFAIAGLLAVAYLVRMRRRRG